MWACQAINSTKAGQASVLACSTDTLRDSSIYEVRLAWACISAKNSIRDKIITTSACRASVTASLASYIAGYPY
jgi:hypothetical protein